jgi:hypothetical protein
MKKQTKIVPLPIHFKTPGRSYSQIGRKGNVALYSVYSDYFVLPDFALPYLLIGFELIVIKVKDGVEVYPAAWQFGKIAWSIPKALVISLNWLSTRLIQMTTTQRIGTSNLSLPVARFPRLRAYGALCPAS